MNELNIKRLGPLLKICRSNFRDFLIVRGGVVIALDQKKAKRLESTKEHKKSILSAEYCVTCNDEKAENIQGIGSYKFEGLEDINFIIPFRKELFECTLYVKFKDDDYLYPFKNFALKVGKYTSESKMIHLLKTLRYYTPYINNKHTFYRRLGFNEMNILTIKQLTDLSSYSSCVERLVKELKISELSNQWKKLQNSLNNQYRVNHTVKIFQGFGPTIKEKKKHNDGSGFIKIFCEENIVIHQNGTIDGIAKGRNLTFWNGKSISGGIIELISLKSIINYGTISVDGVGDWAQGGTISIQCESFINYGKISAVGKSTNGVINIQVCNKVQFKNNGIINPKQNIYVNTTTRLFTPSDLFEESLSRDFSLLTGDAYATQLRFCKKLKAINWKPKIKKREFGQFGVLQIFCEQDIIINEDCIINASGVGVSVEHACCKEVETNNSNELSLLKFGYAKNVAHPWLRGGGIIEIISLKSIINYADILVHGFGDCGRGGTISIKCDSFINYGKISAVGKGGNGHIQICCSSEYKNENIINPKPNIHQTEKTNDSFTKIDGAVGSISILTKNEYQKQFKFSTELHAIEWRPLIKKWYFNQAGVLQIFCAKDIIIHKDCIIDASGCGSLMQAEPQNNAMEILRYGGIIEIISLKSIINHGRISANGIGRNTKGGTISLKCDSFINYGEISAIGKGGNGQIQICYSSQYKNEKVINPKSKCIRLEHQVNTSFTKIEDVDFYLKKIPLKIHSFNGNFLDSYHPKNLLIDDTDRNYESKHLVPSEDWIIFEIDDDDTKCIPKWLKLKNDDYYERGLKEISLSFQCPNSDKWTNEQIIKNIHNNNKNDQWFKLDNGPPKNEQLKFIQLKFNKNHGHEWCNSFYSFVLFGSAF